MKQLKFLLTILLTLSVVPVCSQSVRYVEWWFNDNYAAATKTQINGGSDYFWEQNIPTSSLNEGMHQLNICFVDDSGNRSGISSSYFLKLNRKEEAQYGFFEYWYGNDFENRKQIPLEDGIEVAVILNLEMKELHEGLHCLNYRVGQKNGIYSAPGSSYFYKGMGTNSVGNMIFEYWIDEETENKKQLPFAGEGNIQFDLNFENSAEGMHVLYYRIGKSGEAMGNVHSYYFYNNKSGANVLEYWFNEDPSTKKTLTLEHASQNVIADLETTGLNNGAHSIHFRTGSRDGSFSSVTDSYFMKGNNPYKPAGGNGEQLISDYMYWFDSDTATIKQVAITPQSSYTLNEALPSSELSYGNHTVNIKFRDNHGQWGEMVVDTFYATTGRITKAKIQNLIPNINPLVYTVKEFATVYRYFRITDEYGITPIKDAVIEYTVNNQTFKSTPSDESGYVTIAFPVWGKEVENTDDDYVKVGKIAQMRLAGIKKGEEDIAIIEPHDFYPVGISVTRYRADEQTFGFGLGAKAGIDLEFPALSNEFGLGASTSFAFTNVYENELFTGIKYKHKLNAKGSYKSGNSKTPFIYGQTSTGTELAYKYTFVDNLPTSYKSYLKIAFDFFYHLHGIASDNEDAHYISNAIGSFLGIEQETSSYRENSFSHFGSAKQKFGINLGDKASGSIDISFTANEKFGYSAANASSFDGKTLKMKEIESVSLNVEGDIGFGAKLGYKTESYGLGGTYNKAGALKLSREKTQPFSTIDKASISLVHATEMEVSLDWLDLGFNVTTGKEYNYKFSFTDKLLENAWKYDIGSPLWNFVLNKPFTEILIGKEMDDQFNDLANGLSVLDPKTVTDLKGAFTKNIEKTYTSKLKVEKKFPKMPLLGLDYDVNVNMDIYMDGTFPVGNEEYHFGKKEMLPLVQYEDIDKVRFYLSPFDHLDDLWKDIVHSVTNWGSHIAEKAKEFTGEVIDFFSFGNNEGKKFTNSGRRNFSPVLTRYSELTRSADQQYNFSTIEFDVPGDEKAFNINTKVELKYYYPGGEVLGTTAEKDTFIIVSDVFFFKAYHKYDTLSVAPLGEFKVTGHATPNDMEFLGINSSYPVSLYHKPHNADSWKRMADSEKMVSTNSLGTYCLGVSVKSDKEAPTVNIEKEENSNMVKITITDNMSVFWKSVKVLINGVVTEYTQNNDQAIVTLTEEQLNNDIYVTVYASDLARNERYEVKEFLSSVGIEPNKEVVCDVYPNPADSYCTLTLSETLTTGTEYAIVSTLGEVIERKPIVNNSTQIDVSNLNKGLYFIVVFKEKKLISTLKLMKK